MTTTTTLYGVIVTQTEVSISFRLLPWLTDEQRTPHQVGVGRVVGTREFS
jgi:hypothetical protein